MSCSSCEQMKVENKGIRKALMDTNKNYVELANENLALKKELEEIKEAVVEMRPQLTRYATQRKGLYYDGS